MRKAHPIKAVFLFIHISLVEHFLDKKNLLLIKRIFHLTPSLWFLDAGCLVEEDVEVVLEEEEGGFDDVDRLSNVIGEQDLACIVQTSF